MRFLKTIFLSSVFKTSQRGQALIESIVATMAISILLMGSLSTLYLSFAKLWLRHFSHEALICVASQIEARKCQNQFIKNMHSALPFGRLMVDEFFIYSNYLVIRSRWSFGMKSDFSHESHFRITERQVLHLPVYKEIQKR